MVKIQEVTKSVGKAGGGLEVVGVCVELSGESKQNRTTGETGQVKQALEGGDQVNVKFSIAQQRPEHQEEAKGGGGEASPTMRGEPPTSDF